MKPERILLNQLQAQLADARVEARAYKNSCLADEAKGKISLLTTLLSWIVELWPNLAEETE